MQTLQQELDPSLPGPHAGHPALRDLMADPVSAYAEEVRLLRQKVAMLEAELAATKAARVVETPVPLSAIDFSQAQPSLAVVPSVFSESLTPAVFAFDAQSPPAPEPAQTADSETAPHQLMPTAQPAVVTDTAPSSGVVPVADVVADEPASVTEPVANPGFAQAWSAEEPDASFEERVAERAFFEASAVDEESRTWLLTQ